MHYLNTWNIFSRYFLISKNLDRSLIVTDTKNIKNYLKIFTYFDQDIYEVDNLSHIIDFIKNNNCNYIVDSRIFNLNLNLTRHIELQVWLTLDVDDFIKSLNDYNYEFRGYLEWWDYKKLWDTIHLRLLDSHYTIIISFFGDEIEEIILDFWDRSSSIGSIFIPIIEQIDFWDEFKDFNSRVYDELDSKNIILDNIDISPIYKSFIWRDRTIYLDILKSSKYDQDNLDIRDLHIDDIDQFRDLILWDDNISIYTKRPSTIYNFLDNSSINSKDLKIYKTNLTILKSFRSKVDIVISDDIISKVFIKKRTKKSISGEIDLLLQIKPWDYIVHIDHGVGIFEWIIKKDLWKLQKEFLEISYKSNDKLYVPITSIGRVSKYIWNENPALTNLSTKEWVKKLDRAKADVQKIAKELLETYAQRKLLKWYKFKIYDKEAELFKDSFKYTHTPDQLDAIEDIFWDMADTTPMERLLVWDVWFGKTETVFNAIYQAYLNKKQSILLSPLVVLAYEHYDTAIKRFRDFWLNIWLLTRFQTRSEAKIVLDKLKSWEIDLVIGTHKLLSHTIWYKDLWLLIVDEEHKFGVEDKEKIKKLKWSIDIISMSATPIPRSLNMSLSGVRQMSILKHPPKMRLWVETYIADYDIETIRQAWSREFDRWWQIFFIHNRVKSIEKVALDIGKIFPDKKITIVHGRLSWDELEDRIFDFKYGKYDILISTTVIENGIDFPNVNTMFINQAERFGISQIHQLRWRIWRRDKKWYCYLLPSNKNLSEDQARKLTTIVENSYLWAWFELALRDLEIRWGWDILGINQSWVATEVWLNTYLKMLEEKISTLKRLWLWDDIVDDISQKDTSIDLNIPAFIPDDLFWSELDKLNFYREIESISTLEDLNSIKDEFIYGLDDISIETHNLFKILELKLLTNSCNIDYIKRSGVSYEVSFYPDTTLEWLKDFLELDRDVFFVVNTPTNLKTPCNRFDGDLDFLNYMYSIFTKKSISNNPKIRVKKKN